MEGSPIINVRELGGGLFDGCGSYTVHMLCVIFGASAVASLSSEDIEVVSTPSPDGEVDWDTTVTIRMCGAVAVLTHRAADEARRSVVAGESGSLEFTLPRLEDVALNGQLHKFPYGTGAPFSDLPAHEPGAPVGVHAGLGVQALVVRDALVSGFRGPGAPHLTLDVMRAMAHAMDLVRRRIPSHLQFVSEDLEQ
ncbi:unnamed protein product [Prorocentrum cordatum]|uniref:Gfo/Idh/MocA-like oxidoreductase C-terminal domain-containing protein n=1 Tax=Prorocentrum cordatum TaxID=2364126 RepID=A0ABN9UQ93_9DINO|nr:unnamed protein product [Polarella glacialis]|mmetsp:Transcript_91200/g.247319  ORF Transcript_91200/g.247319 Transcript_91200/m.247319 type:complete len:195 (-) Transcript_91200:26-610(-)